MADGGPHRSKATSSGSQETSGSMLAVGKKLNSSDSFHCARLAALPVYFYVTYDGSNLGYVILGIFWVTGLFFILGLDQPKTHK